ncbi:EamA family transporter [Jatrophihabitans sp. DSM 45814]
MPTFAGNVALTALGPAIWGTTYYATTNWLPSGYPILDGAVRALPAGLVLLAVRPQLPSGKWLWRIAALGMLNVGLFFPLLFVAAERLPGGIVGAIGAAQPLLGLVLTRAMIGTSISAASLAAGVTGVLGVSLLVLRATGRVDPIGLLAGVLGTVLMATAIVLAKRWGPPPMSPITLTGWMLAAGGIVLAPAGLATEGWPAQLSATNWFGLAYTAAISGALSYYLWMRGVTVLPASAVSFLTLVVSVVAATIGWVALGQSLNALQLLGLLIALGSLVAGQLASSATQSRMRSTAASGSATMDEWPPPIKQARLERAPSESAQLATSSFRPVPACRLD